MTGKLMLASFFVLGLAAADVPLAHAGGWATWSGPHRSGWASWSGGYHGGYCCYGGGFAAGAITGLGVGALAGIAASRPVYAPPVVSAAPPVVYTPPPVIYATPPIVVVPPPVFAH